MTTKEGSTKIVNSMPPRTEVLLQWRGHISHIVKMHFIFKDPNVKRLRILQAVCLFGWQPVFA